MQKPLFDPSDFRALDRHDLSPQTDAQTEWWYLQGRIRSGAAERDLMMMLLRRRGARPPCEDGWSLLISMVDPATGAKSVSSLACRALERTMTAETVDVLVDAGMPRELAEAYRDELATYGPPRPVRLSDRPVEIGPGGLDISWDGFSLRQGQGGDLSLTVPAPEGDENLFLNLSAAVPWVRDENVGAHTEFGAMRYALCPRLTVTGHWGADEVSGEAWFDHQWGGDTWFQPARETQQVLGWAWLGINLDDGRDLLALRGQDMLSGEVVDRSTASLGPGAPGWLPRDATWRPLRHWISPDTHARYPVAWELVLPAIDGRLVFAPDAEDCELPLYGFPGAVWEGGGRVQGEIGGVPVQGRGHLELFGYALPAVFEEIKARWIERIDDHVAEILPRQITDAWLRATAGPVHHQFDTEAFGPMLAAPTWDLMSRGGKHWRAIFAILVLRAFGEELERYEALITTIPEMLHAGSLMIDDIQDHSALRRGGPAIHLTYGEGATINAANALYFLPLRAISRHPDLAPDQRETILAIAVDLFVAAHLGQAQDLYAQNWALDRVLADPGRHAEIVLQTCALKTGAPVRALAEMLCVIARCDPALTAAATGFAEALGLAYQIMDDVNSFAGGEDWGKEIGEDVREGRLTYVILRALESLSAPERDRLAGILRAGGPDVASLREAGTLVASSGVLERCRAEARRMVDTAWTDLSRHLPPSQSKTLLRLMWTRLFARQAPAVRS